ncbi:MAG TPA: hypothetical protein VHD33_03985 [Legionellaceae bacterium]|nr:hypothetical protein [Legionellaceae bacterium]
MTFNQAVLDVCDKIRQNKINSFKKQIKDLKIAIKDLKKLQGRDLIASVSPFITYDLYEGGRPEQAVGATREECELFAESLAKRIGHYVDWKYNHENFQSVPPKELL